MRINPWKFEEIQNRFSPVYWAWDKLFYEKWGIEKSCWTFPLSQDSKLKLNNQTVSI
jgi:hypothetical protein